MEFTSDITLGEGYQDEQTGITGVATAISFYQYACERVTLELVVRGRVEEYTFDAPRLISVESGLHAASTTPGGPRPVMPRGSVKSS